MLPNTIRVVLILLSEDLSTFFFLLSDGTHVHLTYRCKNWYMMAGALMWRSRPTLLFRFNHWWLHVWEYKLLTGMLQLVQFRPEFERKKYRGERRERERERERERVPSTSNRYLPEWHWSSDNTPSDTHMTTIIIHTHTAVQGYYHLKLPQCKCLGVYMSRKWLGAHQTKRNAPASLF